MGIFYWGVLAVLLAAAFIMAVRLLKYRIQINHILDELSILEQEDTNYRLSSYCHIGKTNMLIENINRILIRNRETERKLRKENISYRESITSISHDIRTPLTSAKGYIQLIQNHNMDEEKKQEAVKIVARRLYDLTDMLNQLFEYARIEAGEMEYEPELINAGNLFSETLSMFYKDFEEKGFEPEVEVTNIPCHIWADRHAYVRIVENLIKNALVHGTGGYRISFLREEDRAVIRVSNDTDSIENKDLDYLFDRFYTTDESRTRKTTGLGLSIVKKFVVMMGGEASAFLSGKHFTVEITLPCAPLKEKNECYLPE